MARRLKAILEAVDRTSPTLAKVGRGLTALGGVAAAVGAYQLGRQLVNGLREATKAAAVQEAAERQLAQAIETVGLSVDKHLPSIKAQASAFQDLTAVGDEVILKNQSLLVSMGKLTGDGLERATQAALDMGAVTGNIETAFDLVAKASVGYTSTLSRYGIILDESIPKSEKFGAALDKINEMFGGQAAARLRTFDGRLQELHGRFGDLQEAIGGPLRDVMREVFGKVLSPMIQNVTDGINESDAFRNSVLGLSIGFAKLALSISIAFDELNNWVEDKTGQALFELIGKSLDVTTEAIDVWSMKMKHDVPGSTAAAMLAVERATGGVITFRKEGGLLTEGLEDLIAELESMITTGDRVPPVLKSIGDEAATAGDKITTFADIVEEKMPLIRTEFDKFRETNVKIGLTQEMMNERNSQMLNEWLQEDAAATEQYGVFAQSRINWDKKSAAQKKQSALQGVQIGGQATGTLFGIEKAGAYASAVVNTARGVSMALGSAPPPWNFILAALVAAAGAVQVNTIRSTSIGGAARGGIVPGSDRGVDSVVGMLRPGEMVLPRDVSNALLSASGGGQPVMVEVSADSGDLAEILSIRVRNGTARLEATELTGSPVRR